MARPVTRARSRIDRVGSSRHPGPEPYRPQWLVPFPGPGAVSVTGWALGLQMFGPYFALGRDLATFSLGAVSLASRPLLRGAAPPGSSRFPGPEP